MQREREREAARLALQKVLFDFFFIVLVFPYNQIHGNCLKSLDLSFLPFVQMEKTVEFDENQKFLKDLEMLSCSLNDHSMDSEDGSEVVMGPYFGNPLERLGLFMKNDYIGDEDEEEAILNGDGFSDGNGEITLSGNADEDMRGEGEYAEDQEETILNGGGDENGENGICVDRNGLEEDYGDRKNEDENNEDGEEGEIVS